MISFCIYFGNGFRCHDIGEFGLHVYQSVSVAGSESCRFGVACLLVFVLVFGLQILRVARFETCKLVCSRECVARGIHGACEDCTPGLQARAIFGLVESSLQEESIPQVKISC